MLKRIAGHGLTILIIDHDMELVEEVADHITVLNFGRRIADGAAAVLRHPDVIAAYLGERMMALLEIRISSSATARSKRCAASRSTSTKGRS